MVASDWLNIPCAVKLPESYYFVYGIYAGFMQFLFLHVDIFHIDRILTPSVWDSVDADTVDYWNSCCVYARVCMRYLSHSHK